MVKPWDGKTERRRAYRRSTDGYCAVHFDKMNHDDERHADLKESDKNICGKLSVLQKDLRLEIEKLDDTVEKIQANIVGKYWFHFVIGGVCSALLYVAAQNRFSNMEQSDALKALSTGQKEIISVVNNIENKQIQVVEKIKVFEDEFEKLNKRQDILRDLNIKHMTEDHKR